MTIDKNELKKQTKQVIVWRNDLKVRKGKIGAQCAHASLAVFTKRMKPTGNVNEKGEKEYTLFLTEEMINWLENSFTKIVPKCKDENELIELYKKAEELGLPCSIITDSGLTEFHGVPTKTCMAIGPALSEDIDKITGCLELL